VAYSLDTSKFITPVDLREALELMAFENKHRFYSKVVDRYESMLFFYDADKTQDQNKLDRFKKLFPKSIVESNEEYDSRVRRMRMLPIERSVIKAISRIYNGHHAVDRKFDGDKDFWSYKTETFDDSGSSADLFFSQKVFPLRQIGGFCAVAVDWMNDSEGNAITDSEGKVVPYAYLIRPNEIINFERVYGELRWVLTSQNLKTVVRHTLFATNAIYVVEVEKTEELGMNEKGVYSPELHISALNDRVKVVENPLGKVPVSFTTVEPDAESGFIIGRPARYHLLDMYIAATEVFYQLNEIGLMYSRPVSIYPESMLKDMQGVTNDNDEIDMSVVRNNLGQIAVIPHGQEAPSKLFWQADMSGMEALKGYFFQLLDHIYQWASIRDKGNVVSNNSGVSKYMDTVEERGLLASEADAMEKLEREVFGFMHELRREEYDHEKIKYAKEFDLSTPNDLFGYLSEGGQYGVLTKEMFVYLTQEFLRKIGAPQEDVDRIINEAESNFTALKRYIVENHLGLDFPEGLSSQDDSEDSSQSEQDYDEDGDDENINQNQV